MRAMPTLSFFKPLNAHQLVSAERVQQTTSDMRIPALSAATVSLTSVVMVATVDMSHV